MYDYFIISIYDLSTNELRYVKAFDSKKKMYEYTDKKEKAMEFVKDEVMSTWCEIYDIMDRAGLRMRTLVGLDVADAERTEEKDLGDIPF